MSRLLTLSVLVLAACAPAASAQTPAIPGDYIVTLAPSDFGASASQELRSRAAGTWRLSFHAGNHYVVTQNGQEVIQGTYRVNGNEVTFEAGDTGPLACNTTARVAFRVNHGNLIQFTSAGPDLCVGRAAVLTARPFARVPETTGGAETAPSILGEYTVTLSAADLAAYAPSDTRDAIIGSWRMAFHGGNHYVVHHEGEEVIQGSYQLSGNQLVFGDDETGRYVCNLPATYNWVLSGNQLIFTLVGDDPCGARPVMLTVRSWTRAP